MIRAILHSISTVKRFLPTFLYFSIPAIILLLISIIVCIFYPWQLLVTYQPLVTLCLLPVLGLFFCTLHALINVLKPLYFGFKVEQHDADIMSFGSVITYEGAPRTGKTLSMTYDGYLLAQYSNNRAIIDYYVTHSMVSQHGDNYFSDDVDRRAWHALQSSVEYYWDNPQLIPYLLSITPVRAGDQMSARLEYDYFMQKKRAPEYSVWLADESADILANYKSKYSGLKDDDPRKQEYLAVADMTSKIGHYIDGHFGFAEQDAGENMLSVRRVVSFVRRTLGVSKVCQPHLLLWVLNRKTNRIIRHNNCPYKRASSIIRLRRLIARIGFLCVSYVDRILDTTSEQSKYYLPIDMPCKYESRGYRDMYRALDLPIELDAHKSMYVS